MGAAGDSRAGQSLELPGAISYRASRMRLEYHLNGFGEAALTQEAVLHRRFCAHTQRGFVMDDPPRASLPDSDPAPPVPASVRSNEPDEEDDLTHLPPEYRAAVRRLRAKVDRATTALNRLRAENERLRQRVQELEQRPALQPDTTTFVIDDDPEALQDRISGFIEAIDTYLENGTVPPEGASTTDASA